MWRQAWKSYLASLHPRSLRKAYDEGKLFWFIYWLIIYPTMMRFATDSLEIYEAIYLIMVRLIPYFIMGWSNINSKFLMSKMMFLCPIKEEERQQYINCVLFIKIGVSVFVSILIEVVYGIFYETSLIKILCIALSNFSVGIATFISLEAMGKMDEKIYAVVKDKTYHPKHYWINNLAVIAACFVIGAVSLLDIGAEKSLAFACYIGIVVMMVLLLVFDIVMIIGEYKAAVALAGNYELSFRILGKVEKRVKFDMFEKKSY